MKFVQKALLTFAAAGFVFAGCTSAQTDTALSDDEVYQTIEDAYVYASPLIIIELFKQVTTNTVEPTDIKAPVNQLFHARSLATPQLASITRPNVDTVYSQAYLDLSAGPILFEKPETGRFLAIQVFDGYSNSPDILGTGFPGGNGKAVYVFTGPGFNDKLPEGVIEVKVPTNLVWLLIRTKSEGVADLPNVYSIQAQMKMKPFAYYGKDYTPPKGTYSAEYDFVPLKKFGSFSLQEYFDFFNRLSVANPPAAEDAPSMERFARFGIGPGLKFDFNRFTEPQKARLNTIHDRFVNQIVPNEATVHSENGWIFLDNSVGMFGTDYKFRASVAYNGFANPVAMAVYPSIVLDNNNQLLSGEKNYQLHFDRGMLPPYGEYGFWSITVYDLQSGRLIDNTLNRYNINERSPVVYNEDGSLDLYLQHKNPGGTRENNWLPVGSGNFSITMRIYRPDVSVLTGRWKPPALQTVK